MSPPMELKIILDNVKSDRGNSLAVQWLGLCASTAGGSGLALTRLPHPKKRVMDSACIDSFVFKQFIW